ncbi:disulfide bond formation protein B [Falsochrobactrum shanghaiense]|uniref:Disulfide bond formation protein B n=1 Tax=Falsochrobactrum shanghaiense TaxID=2201899 RepID=A0A316J809_9HYPH|nr:disulfide bond formation protein B [Falsochrobactrum shanghaiense]PWL16919.1 disulfide bond formation protein B [Falsochrobactrum shanghaiense]
MAFALNNPVGKIQTCIAAIMTLGLAATVGTALLFEHIGGFMPCKLCLEERIPYYIGIPIALIAWLSSALKWPPILTRGLLLLAALVMTCGLALAIFHTGVELKYWPGPADCSAATMKITLDAGNLLSDLNSTFPPACDTAPGHFLGLSFAGWNVVASLLFAAIGYYGAFAKNRR